MEAVLNCQARRFNSITWIKNGVPVEGQKETRRKTGRQLGKVLISCLFPEIMLNMQQQLDNGGIGNVSNLKGTPQIHSQRGL